MDNFNKGIFENKKIRNGIEVVGIGTDMYIFDSFGPIVAELLKEANLKHITARGSFEDLFTANSIRDKIDTLNKDKIIIGVDSCIGKEESINKTIFRSDKGIAPGKALGKNMPIIGEHSIVFVIDSNDLSLFQNKHRLGTIYREAKKLVEIFKELDMIISRMRKEERKKMAYYAVKNGNTVEKAIFTNWNACEAEVKGAKGVAYKKFKTIEEANDFLGLVTKLDISIKEAKERKETIEKFESKEIEYNEDTCIAYVDGSFEGGKCSYGVVFIENNKVIYENGKEVTTWKEMRNVSGEVQAAMVAVEEAYRMGYKNIVIHYDYEGIEKWVTGVWKAKKEYTKEYRQYMLSMLEHIDITFKKVKGHSGDKWNDYVDKVAGAAIK